MAHEITQNEDGSFCFGRVEGSDQSWHKLGFVFPKEATFEEIRIMGNMNHTNSLQPMGYLNSAGEFVATDSRILLRSDGKALTVVPGLNEGSKKGGADAWQDHDDSELQKVIEHLQSLGANIDTMGLLLDGKRFFVNMTLPETRGILNGKDEYKPNLLVYNNHIFGQSSGAKNCFTRTVCNNTFTMAEAETTNLGFKFSHRQEFDSEAVNKAVELAIRNFSTYLEANEYLASKSFDMPTLISYFNAVFPKQGETSKAANQNDSVMLNSLNSRRVFEVLDSQPGAELGAGTWYQAFNAVTYHIDHVQGRSEDTRRNSAWFGSGNDSKTKALKLAIEYANAAA